MWWRLSARIIACARLTCRIGPALVVECADDQVEIAEDAGVHLGKSLLTAGFGGGDDLQDLSSVLMVLGQELGRW